MLMGLGRLLLPSHLVLTPRVQGENLLSFY